MQCKKVENLEPEKKTRKRFNISQVLNKIKIIPDDVIGDVYYGDLSLAEEAELSNAKLDDMEKGWLMMCKMLQKADPDVTVDKLKNLPRTEGDRLVKILLTDLGFLPAGVLPKIAKAKLKGKSQKS